jgi:hypothetical protein
MRQLDFVQNIMKTSATPGVLFVKVRSATSLDAGDVGTAPVDQDEPRRVATSDSAVLTCPFLG